MSNDQFFKAHIFNCGNERPAGHPLGCCVSRGSDELKGYMKEKIGELGIEGVRINQAGCLGRCDTGPVMVVYPEGVWYTYNSKADIDEIVQSHIVEGKIVDRLRPAVDR
ncbi:MAG: ferredoxin [Rhodospirillaceae bacterium]|jgi:(2Fe-2S) ferredoxin|nr:ferredoxin [Rhodospirillaceae bacterium]MDP6926854.1 (2Fe-2S) ferredoxin domain-containing protein [Rhodospirillales bacterium]